jgi:hypothetical protein
MGSYALFIFGISTNSLDSDGLILFILFAIINYVALQFILLNRVGFYISEPDTKRRRWDLYLPIFVFIISIVFVIYEYKMDNTSSDDFELVSNDDIENEIKPDKYQLREEIMSDTSLTIVEKFENIDLGKNKDQVPLVYFYYESVDSLAESGTDQSISRIYSDFEKISDGITSYARAEKKADSIVVCLGNGRKSDIYSKNYIGYLERQNVFILIDEDKNSDCRYSCVNGVSGETFCGIPVFESSSSDLYSDLQYIWNNEKVDLKIKIWFRDESSNYKELLDETIPMNNFFMNAQDFPCKITGIHWEKNVFKFILSASRNGKEENLKINAIVSPEG